MGRPTLNRPPTWTALFDFGLTVLPCRGLSQQHPRTLASLVRATGSCMSRANRSECQISYPPRFWRVRWSSRVGDGISASDSAVAHSARERATLGMSEWIPERDSSGANHDSPRRHMSL